MASPSKRLLQVISFLAMCVAFVFVWRTAMAHPLGRVIVRLASRGLLLVWLAYSVGKLLERMWNIGGMFANKVRVLTASRDCDLSLTRTADE